MNVLNCFILHSYNGLITDYLLYMYTSEQNNVPIWSVHMSVLHICVVAWFDSLKNFVIYFCDLISAVLVFARQFRSLII